MINKRLINTGVEAAAPAALDPLQNFETVTYTGNGGTQKITGYIRKGAAFNGSSSYITINSTSTTPFDASAKNFTISAWINVSTFQNDATIITKYGASSGVQSYQLGFQGSGNNTKLVFYEKDGGTTAVHNSSTVLTAGQWYHIGLVRNSTQVIFYINGSAETISATNSINDGGSQSIIIGRQEGYSTTSFNGKIDQVRLFNTALNSTQIGQLADEEYGDAENSVTDFFGNGSGVALYQLDEDANDTGGAGQSGYIGDAAKFNGSSSQIALNNLSIGAGDFTISLWIKPTAITNANYHMTFAQNGYSSGTGIAMYTLGTSTTTANFVPYISVGGTAYNIVSSSGISVNQWTHLALVRDYGNNWKVYMNGTLLTTYTSAGLTTDFTNSISYLGRHSNGLYRFNGYIDDVRIYSSALDSNDIGYIANNDTANIPTSNLSYHYELETDATDSAGSVDGVETDITYGYAGTPTNVNFLGMAFQPDFVWIKTRSDIGGSNHFLFDSVRGATNRIFSNLTLSEAVDTDSLLSFDSNGFTVGDDISCNGNGESVVAWCWKAGGAAVSGSGTNGIANVLISANTAAGFSIVEYDGAGVDATVEHGLDSAPELIIVKRTDSSGNWITYAEPLGVNKYLYLNSAAKEGSFTGTWGTAVDSTSFGLTGSFSDHNNGSGTYIAYCFHSVDGYQKIGSYTGNGDGSFGTSAVAQSITTGFRPRFVMIKITSEVDYWIIFDSERKNTSTTYSQFQRLIPSLSNEEASADSGGGYWHIVDFTDTGFDLGQDPSLLVNKNGASYIYLAIA